MERKRDICEKDVHQDKNTEKHLNKKTTGETSMKYKRTTQQLYIKYLTTATKFSFFSGICFDRFLGLIAQET